MNVRTPSPEELGSLRAVVGDGPVVLVNLIKFREPNGLERFGDYARLTAPMLSAAGTEVVYSGQAGPSLTYYCSDPWQGVRASGKIGETLVHCLHDEGVEFNRRDPGCPTTESRQDIPPAARPDNEGAGSRTQLEGRGNNMPGSPPRSWICTRIFHNGCIPGIVHEKTHVARVLTCVPSPYPPRLLRLPRI